MPSGACRRLAWRDFELSAAWISALDGMQPTLRQVPPAACALDEHRVDAELAGADGADIAARTGADDEQLAAKLVHVLAPRPAGLSPPRSGRPGAASRESSASGAGAGHPLSREIRQFA